MSTSSVNSSFSSIHNRAASFKASLTNSLTSHQKAQAPVVSASPAVSQPNSASTPQISHHSAKVASNEVANQSGVAAAVDHLNTSSNIKNGQAAAIAMTASAIIRATNKGKMRGEPGFSDVDNYGLEEDSEDEEEDDDDDDDDEEIHDATGHNNTDNDADDKILTL